MIEQETSKTIEGVVASEGIGIGRIILIDEELPVPDHPIRQGDVKSELLKLDAALAQSRDQLISLQERNKDNRETCKILDSQLLILVDPLFVGEAIQKVKTESRNVEKVVEDIIAEFSRTFSQMSNPYMKQRAVDITDVGMRILRNLLGVEAGSLDDLPENTLLACTELVPSDVARLDTSRVNGIVTEIGGRDSHAAILARSLGIPALLGVEDLRHQVHNGDLAILDGLGGQLILHPTEEVLAEFHARQTTHAEARALLESRVSPEASTACGVPLVFRANISVPAEVEAAMGLGARGIGLFRTEFLFLKGHYLPTEDEQYEAYSLIARGCRDEGVAVIRTLDVGGDKQIPYLGIPKEANPFMGWRSIRFCLENPDIFKVQLRAILRASAHGNVRLLYPMIANLDELHQANGYLHETKEELHKEGIPFDEGMPVGTMIEVPSAALLADELAREVQFFSIGTSDLIQFTMAADRTNQRVETLSSPYNIAVLRLIQHVVQAAHRNGIEVACCGEMSGDAQGGILLLGLGVLEYSMSVFAIPRMKHLLSQVTLEDARELARQALEMSSHNDVRELVSDYVRRSIEQDGATAAR